MFSSVFSSGFTRYIRNVTSFEISLYSSLEESQTHWGSENNHFNTRTVPSPLCKSRVLLKRILFLSPLSLQLDSMTFKSLIGFLYASKASEVDGFNMYEVGFEWSGELCAPIRLALNWQTFEIQKVKGRIRIYGACVVRSLGW